VSSSPAHRAASAGRSPSKCAAAGARVALVARDEQAIKELATELGGTAHPCDLSDLEQVRGLLAISTVALVDPTLGDSPLALLGPAPSERPTLTVEGTDGLELRGYGPEIFAEDRRLLGVLAAMASRAWQGQQLAQQGGAGPPAR